jgi:cyclase
VRVVILTNHHEDRSGTNAKFLAAGAQIIAQENVARNLATYHPLSGQISPPTITYPNDYALRLGGVEVKLMHFGNAHTDGDTVVYFPNLKVVAVGDLFTPDTPDPDFSGAGSLVDWGPVLGQILKLDFDVVVPSKGPMITRDDLVAFKTKIEILISRARALVNRGVPRISCCPDPMPTISGGGSISLKTILTVSTPSYPPTRWSASIQELKRLRRNRLR